MYKWNWIKLNGLSAEGWTVEKGKDATSECAGIEMLGGFGNFGVGAVVFKQFQMPPHYRVKVKLTFAKVDSWDNEEGFILID